MSEICKCGHKKHKGLCGVIPGVSDNKNGGIDISSCECEIGWQDTAREKCPAVFEIINGAGEMYAWLEDDYKTQALEELRRLIENEE